MADTSAPDGPYLTAAVLCDQVLEEKSGRLTLVRIATDVIVKGEGPNPPEAMPAVRVPLRGLVTFNAGGRPGDYTIALTAISPDGTSRSIGEQRVHFKHEFHTHNLIVKGQLQTALPGLYWLMVMLDGREMTRLPLLLQYQRQPIGSPSPAPGTPTETGQQKTS